MNRRILLLGPPGSGKGTIAARLETELALPHLSSGHLLRQEVEKGSPAGCRAKTFIDNGELVPDTSVLEVIEPALKGAIANGGFVLDGFPRNRTQAIDLDRWLAEHGIPLERVLLFTGPEDVLAERITGRRTCPECGRVYHGQTVPPKRAGICDLCGIPLVQREDDGEAVVHKRYEIYRRETQPLEQYYRQQDKLAVIPATLPLEGRFSAVVEDLTR